MFLAQTLADIFGILFNLGDHPMYFVRTGFYEIMESIICMVVGMVDRINVAYLSCLRNLYSFSCNS